MILCFFFQSYKQCESCGVAWKNLDSVKCARCEKPPTSSVMVPEVPEPTVNQSMLRVTIHVSSHNNNLFFSDSAGHVQGLARIATDTAHAARSHAMDVRIKKQPLHTTAGLSAAKSNMNTGENKVFITAECRIKSTSKKDQKTTDPDCGQWGKPWTKETYLSGMLLSSYSHISIRIVSHYARDSMTEVLDDYLATLNVSWANNGGMVLERYVSHRNIVYLHD
jgi:hypothetical protein